ncbi:MAG TPA: tetratricopeptide repeat protein [Verrucomicrobiae bacterium]|nr:tetratricopeptide repeat protein [Verrucomicrobiae bacterium]
MARSRVIGLLLALVTLLLYLPVRQFEFVVFDDPDYILENRYVLAGITLEGIQWAFTTLHVSNWHPITWLSHMIDSELFGPNPAAMHLVNVMIHVANSVLLLRLLLQITGRMWPSAIIAALFAWHPLHVESVAWISERKDVLSTFFGLLALGSYARYAQSDSSRTLAENAIVPRSRDYAMTVVWLTLGLMSKPMLVTLPFVMLLLDVWPLNRWHKDQAGSGLRRVAEKWPLFVLTVLFCVITFAAQRGEAVVGLERLPFGARVLNAIAACLFYIGKTIWPAGLSVIYPLNSVPSGKVVVIALSLLAGVSAAAIQLRRSAPFVAVGWFWFLGMLVPVIGLVQVGGQSMADRYMYLPIAGLLIVVVFGLEKLAARIKAPDAMLLGVGAVAGVLCLGATRHQLGFWKDSETLFRRALAVTERNEIAHINLGVALEQADRKDEALQQYYQALTISTNRAQTHNDIANLLADLGKRDDAQRHYLRALELKPNAPLAHQNLGTLLAESGDFAGAMKSYQEAARLAPESATPHYLMGKACWREDRHPDAVAHFREALRRDPQDFQSLTLLARVLATSGDASVRNGVESVMLAEKANQLTASQQPFVLDVLAMAYAETGNFGKAAEVSRQALQIAREAQVQELIDGLEARLRLYESGTPFRQPQRPNMPSTESTQQLR